MTNHAMSDQDALTTSEALLADCRDQLTSAREECARLKINAKRYLWLRDDSEPDSPITLSASTSYFHGHFPLTSAQVDAAIDDAIEREQIGAKP